MLTRNVHYSEQPEYVMITSNGNMACVEFPINVERRVIGDGEESRYEWVAEKVYSLMTKNTPNLEERINANYEEWLAKAKEPSTEKVTMEDLIEAIDALTDIVIGE